MFLFALSSPYLKYKTKGTKKGTARVKTTPEKIAIIAYCSPQNFAIMGNELSFDVAPPAKTGPSKPKYRTIIGVKTRQATSRIIFDKRATDPNAGLTSCEIIVDDKL